MIGTLLPLLMLFGNALHHHENEAEEEHCILCSSGAADRRRDNAVPTVLQKLTPGGRGGNDIVPVFVRHALGRLNQQPAPLAQLVVFSPGPSLDLVDSATSSPRNLWLYEGAPTHRGPPRELSPRAPPRQA